MLRLPLRLLAVVLLGGCDSRTNIVLPTTPFTAEQKIAIANEDAAACNCGRDFDENVSTRDD